MKVNATNKVNFGHFLLGDSGASDRKRSSLKLTLVSDSGEILDTFEGKSCPEGFKKNEDYVNGISEQISKFAAKNTGTINKLRGTDKQLKAVMIYAPGAAIDNKIGVIKNLVLENEEPLKNIDFNDVLTNLKQTYPQNGLKIAPKAKLIATNDMIGTGGALLNKLLEIPNKIKNGYRASFYMAGGGLGAGEIEVVDNKVLLKSTEGGHVRASGTGENIKVLESYGASSTALITNFAKALGIDKENIKNLVSTANGRIVTDYVIKTDKADEIAALQKTELFNEKISGDKHSFSLAGIDKATHEKACKKTINKFIEALAIGSSNKIIEGSNDIILTGPLTKGVGFTIKENPHMFKNQTLTQLIMKRASKLMDAAGESMSKLYNINIIDDIPVSNNTQGGLTALKGEFAGEGRGNWLLIPLKALKKAI